MIWIVVEQGPWRAEWHGGRLADVFHLEYDHALHCIQIGEWDDGLNRDALSVSRAHLGADDVLTALQEFVSEDGATYLRESCR